MTGDGVSVAMEDQIHHAPRPAPRASRFLTVCAAHLPPRRVLIPRRVSSAAMRSSPMPSACSSRAIGATLAANVSAFALRAATAMAEGGTGPPEVAKHGLFLLGAYATGRHGRTLCMALG